MIIIKKKLIFSSKNCLHLLSVLNRYGGESRFVGGCVRDALLNKSSSDVDIATTLLPSEVTKVLTDNDINFITIGINFGTVAAIINGEQIEITTLREDLSSNGRHPKVVYTDNFEEDAKRRDFTINSLSYCPFKEEIYDYCNGTYDLENLRVIFIGDPKIRIQEDYLRILRFFRFSNKYGVELDKQGLNACIDLKHNLILLSKERIKWEIDKILAAHNFESILEIMLNTGILQIIFPITYFSSNALRKAVLFAADENLNLSLSTKYALIFYGVENLSVPKLIDLKCSKNEASTIFSVIEFVENFDTQDHLFLLKKAWLEKADFLDYVVACIGLGKLDNTFASKFILNYKNTLKPKFPINGSDLIKLGKQGESIGQSLIYLKNIWIENNFSLSKTQLLNILQNQNE